VSNLVVVSGSSGVGKGTLIRALLERIANARLTVSDTTRVPRDEEVDGREYNFIGVSEFKKRIDEGCYIEWEHFFDTYYGTPKSEIENAKLGEFVILELDPKGALAIKHAYPQAALVFILPGSINQLIERLHIRGTESRQQVNDRVTRALEDLNFAGFFDYAIVNDDLGKAIEDLLSVFDLLHFRIANCGEIIARLRKEAGDIRDDCVH